MAAGSHQSVATEGKAETNQAFNWFNALNRLDILWLCLLKSFICIIEHHNAYVAALYFFRFDKVLLVNINYVKILFVNN